MIFGKKEAWSSNPSDKSLENHMRRRWLRQVGSPACIIRQKDHCQYKKGGVTGTRPRGRMVVYIFPPGFIPSKVLFFGLDLCLQSRCRVVLFRL